MVNAAALQKACHAAAESEKTPKAKGALLDPLIKDGVGALKPVFEKALPQLTNSELESFLFGPLATVVENIVSGYTP